MNKNVVRWKKTGRTIGAGGQAEVFVVLDQTGEFPGDCALKSWKNTKRMGRIDVEILTMRNLYAVGAPVVQVLDDYKSAGSPPIKPWYVMPLVPGGSLRAGLVLGSCLYDSELGALQFFEKLFAAVSSLHSQKVAHRDLKPENILLSETGAPLLCDLGLCLPMEQADKDQRQTDSLERMGSIHYIPKEAFYGGQPIGRNQLAYDYFGMGKLLYELFNGRVLPGYESHRSPEHDLSRSRSNSEFYRLVNVILDGLLHDDPQRRQECWEVLPSNLQVMRNSLTGEDVQPTTSEPPHARRLMLITDALHARDQGIVAENAAPDTPPLLDEIIDLVQEKLGAMDSYKYLSSWAKNNSDYFQLCTPEKSSVASLLEGPYVRSRAGLHPLESQGWRRRDFGRAELVLKLNSKNRDKFPSFVLALTVGESTGREVAYSFVVRQEPGNVGKSDVVESTLERVEAKRFDASFESQVIQLVERKFEQFLDTVTSTFETILKTNGE